MSKYGNKICYIATKIERHLTKNTYNKKLQCYESNRILLKLKYVTL